MSQHRSEHGIECPIGLFDRQEAKIEALTRAVNAARAAPEKRPLARALIEEVEVLLACRSYDEANPSCSLCRSFSELRLGTASLIVKIGGSAAAR